MAKRSQKKRAPLRKKKIDVRAFLSDYPPHIRAIANTLRKIVTTTLPRSTEAVYTGWQLIGYRIVDGKESSYCCFIAPTEECVKLGFEHGAHLTDPHGLLSGEGSQVRQVVITSAKGIRTKALRALIAESAIYIMFRRAVMRRS